MPSFRVLNARLQALAAACVAVGRNGVAVAFPGAVAYDSPRGRAVVILLDQGRGVIVTAGEEGPVEPPAWVRTALSERGFHGITGSILWFDGAWHSNAGGDSAEQLSTLFPGLLTTVSAMVEILKVINPQKPNQFARDASYGLLYACETHTADRDLFRWMLRFTTVGDDTVDAGFAVLTQAGLTKETNPAAILDGVFGLPATDALERVTQHFLANDIDTVDYPLENLRTERLEVGWLVTCPTTEMRFGRAVFFVGDDGEVEQSSTSIPPNEARETFARNYRTRHQPARPELHIFDYLGPSPLPEVTPASIDHARRNPGGWLSYLDPSLPPDTPGDPAFLMGAREIDAQGQLTGRTWVNPDFIPQQPATAGMTFGNHFELVFWRTFKGYNTIGEFLTALSKAALIAVRSAEDPAVLDYWRTDGSPASTLPVFTSVQFAPTDLPPDRLYPLTGLFLLDAICPQPEVKIQFNPGGNLSVGLAGDKLTTWWNEWKQADRKTANA